MKILIAVALCAAAGAAILTWAPWMDDESIATDVFYTYAHKDGTVTDEGLVLCHYRAMLAPLGRWVNSCEGGAYVFALDKTAFRRTQDEQPPIGSTTKVPGPSPFDSPEAELEIAASIMYDRINTYSIPSKIYAAQLGHVFRVNGTRYLMVRQPNSMFYIPPPPGGGYAEWGGVLVWDDEINEWSEFFEIKTIKNPEGRYDWDTIVIHNPVGIFEEEGRLYLDLADDNGAGSGEGLLTRMVSDDGGETWTRAGCYYFTPERYYVPTSEDPMGITPNQLNETTGCPYQ